MIRHASVEDNRNLAALSIQVWLNAYAKQGIRAEISKYVLSTFTEQHYNDLYRDPKYRILVYIESNHLVGFVTINLESFFKDKSNGYEVVTLYVHDCFQGKGIGRFLLSEIKEQFGPAFWLSTWICNTAAIRFYNHMKFRDIGHLYFKLENERHENRVFASCI